MTSLSRLLASAVIIAAVAMPLPVFAAKQKPPVMTTNPPKGDWTVGPINAPSSSGIGYCSMKNDFVDGLSLVFARDAEGSNSIALDFHKKLLKTGGQYDVTLKTGPAVRKATAIAATPSVLIVQMGLERDFYNVMLKKDTLVMEFGSAQASFMLSGTPKAMDVLTQCAQALGAGKKFTETKVAATGAVSDAPATAVASIQPAAAEGAFTGYLGGDPAAATLAAAPLPKVAKDSLAMQSLNEELKQQIAELKLQNRKLLAENQAIAERMIATDNVGAQMEVAIKAESEDRERSLAAENMRLRAALNELPEPAPVAVEQVEPAAGEAVATPAFLPALLQAARISGEVDSRNAGALVWSAANDVYGSGEERSLDAGSDLAMAVAGYMNEVRTRCGGDFANTSGKVRTLRGRKVIEGELACLDGQHDAAAAILFVEENGTLAVISHETAPARMTAALAARDAVISAITGK